MKNAFKPNMKENTCLDKCSFVNDGTRIGSAMCRYDCNYADNIPKSSSTPRPNKKYNIIHQGEQEIKCHQILRRHKNGTVIMRINKSKRV